MSSYSFQRQPDTKDGAFAFFTARADLAAVTMYGLFTQRKPEACALISILCVQPGKGVEDLFRLVLVEPYSIIRHDDLGMQAADSRLCGQVCKGPKGVADQSNSRIRPPISPPPARNSGITEVLSKGFETSMPLI